MKEISINDLLEKVLTYNEEEIEIIKKAYDTSTCQVHTK